MNMQTKVLAHVKVAIEESQREGARGQTTGLEMVHSPGRASNVGTVYAQREFLTRFVLDYGFFDGYATLTISGPAVKKLLAEKGIEDHVAPSTGVKYRMTYVDGVEFRVDNFGPAIKFHYLKYTEGERIQEILALINRLALASSHRDDLKALV